MATLEQLVEQGILRKHEADLESWEMPERHVYVTETFDFAASFVAVAPKVRGRNLSAGEQVEQLLYEYVLGRPMTYSVHYRKLDPLSQHVWEFKTPDIRVFGWFARRRHFIATFAEFKDNLSKEKQKKSTNTLYRPYIDHAITTRGQIPLDEPKLITGLSYADVL
jgi:hypothetical protein